VIVLILTQDWCVVCDECTIGSKSSWTHPMELLGEWVMWNLVSIHLEIVLVSVQYWCMVCVKRIIGLEIVLDAPDRTPS
jgi:predicted alpha/beta hydrolase